VAAGDGDHKSVEKQTWADREEVNDVPLLTLGLKEV
jgi:hypothetical protein